MPMDNETTISQGLHIADESARYDAACKRLLSERQILARIMKECIEEYKNCDVHDIEEKYIEGTPQVSSVPVLPDEEGTIISGMDTEDKSIHEGTVTYDVKFRATLPNTDDRISIIINVEAQNDFYPGYPLISRAVFYCCRMISSQYGREFTGSSYDKIKKVYSIWICMNPPKRRENTITRYRLTEEQVVGSATEPVKNYDLLSVVMLCLGDPDRENYDGILRMLDVLFSTKASEAEKRKILQDDYEIKMIQSMEGRVSDMCNLSKGIREKGEAIGIEKGIVIGRNEGRNEGRAESRIEDILSLMDTLSLSVEQAMDALKIPVTERQKYVELLSKQ